MEQYEPTHKWKCIFRDPDNPHWAIAKDDYDGMLSLTHKCKLYTRVSKENNSNVMRIRSKVIENKVCDHCREKPSDHMIGLFLLYDWDNNGI